MWSTVGTSVAADIDIFGTQSQRGDRDRKQVRNETYKAHLVGASNCDFRYVHLIYGSWSLWISGKTCWVCLSVKYGDCGGAGRREYGWVKSLAAHLEDIRSS